MRYNLVPQSYANAAWQYWNIISLYRKDGAGGGMFGFDWQTMHAIAPHTFNRLQYLAKRANELRLA